MKHYSYLSNQIEIQDNRGKETSMALVNNPENSIRISTKEHLTNPTNNKTEATEMEEQYSIPSKYTNTNETTVNPLMPGGKQKGHTYLNKLALENCWFV